MRLIKFYAILLFAGCLVLLKWALFAFERIFTVLRNYKLPFFQQNQKFWSCNSINNLFRFIIKPHNLICSSKSLFPVGSSNMCIEHCASSAILFTCIEAKNNCNMVWDIFLFHYCHYWFPISISLSIIQNDPRSIERNRHWILIVCFSFKEHIQTDLLHCHE